MKDLIKKWLDIPTTEELYGRIDSRVQKQAAKHYNKLRKSDKDRYKSFAAGYKQGKFDEKMDMLGYSQPDLKKENV